MDETIDVPPVVAQRLNERFYRVSPHAYFEMRLLSLLATDSRSGVVDEEDLPSTPLGEQALGRELEFDAELLSREAIDAFGLFASE